MARFYGKRMARHLRFVVILRDPKERLLSVYNHFHPQQDFQSWAMDGIKLLETGRQTCSDVLASEIMHDPKQNSSISAICRGNYVNGLRKWTGLFHPSQFLLVPFSSFAKTPKYVLKAILEHLNYEGFERKRLEAKIDEIKNARANNNATTHGKPKSKVGDFTNKKLDRYYARYSAELRGFVRRHAMKSVRAAEGTGLFEYY
jgi:hypothetical protein